MDYEAKKRWLKRYRDGLREEQILVDEIDQLRAEAERVTPRLTGEPGGGGSGDNIPRAVERIVEAQHRLQCQINLTYVARNEIVETIDGAKKFQEREILRRRYLLGQRWEEIACAMHMDFRWVTRQHHQIVDALPISEKYAPQSPI